MISVPLRHGLALGLAGAALVAPLTAQAWEFCSPLHTYNGENVGDNFGWIVDSLADLDGDGARDVVITAPFHNATSGRVYVYSTGTGDLLHMWSGSASEQFGNHAAGLGDLDGDGIGEIIVGAPGTGGLAGSAYVYSGASGALLTTLVGEAVGDRFGMIVDTAGDVDGDGVEDILVGAPNQGPLNTGRAYLYNGATFATMDTWSGTAGGDMVGFGVGPAGDIDDDGKADFLIGATGAGVGGEVWLIDGATFQTLCTISGEPATQGNFGRAFLETVGDLDQDGVEDFYITDWTNSTVAPGAGKAWIWSGATCTLIHEFASTNAGDNFGGGHPEVGDVDGDGVGDLMFCAWTNNDGGNAAGQAVLHSGADGRVLGKYTGDVPGEWLASDLTGLGDVDGDGRPDYLISVASINDNGPGAAYVISGDPAPPRNVCTSSAHSGGGSARMTYRRSTNLTTNDFRLRVENAVASQTGVFFFGTSEQAVPFGDGTLCVGGTVQRLGAVTLSAGGSKQITLDFSQAPLLGVFASGVPTYFQFWFRDPAGAGAGFNLSDALLVNWCP